MAGLKYRVLVANFADGTGKGRTGFGTEAEGGSGFLRSRSPPNLNRMSWTTVVIGVPGIAMECMHEEEDDAVV